MHTRSLRTWYTKKRCPENRAPFLENEKLTFSSNASWAASFLGASSLAADDSEIPNRSRNYSRRGMRSERLPSQRGQLQQRCSERKLPASARSQE